MKQQFQTPILFLVFNRLDTTQKVFAQIKKQKPTYLFIASDGPRSNKHGEVELCQQIRDMVMQEIDRPCDVQTLFRVENLGCKDAVSSAITWFFNHVEQGIILEDDCVPHDSFFPFCEKMLQQYQNDTRVMMITGTNYYPNHPSAESYFFSKHMTIWGRATRRRAWDKYDVEMNYYKYIKKTRDLQSVFPRFIIRKHFERTFNLIANNQMNTRDIQWIFACLLNNGLCITPTKNTISNIGIIGTFTKGTSNVHYMPTEEISFPLKHPKYVHTLYDYDEKLFFGENMHALFFSYVIDILKKVGLYKTVKGLYDFIKK